MTFKLKGRSIFFVDSKSVTCREWVVIDDRPKVKFEFKKEHPLEFCNTFIAVTPSDFKEGQAAWEAQFAKKDK